MSDIKLRIVPVKKEDDLYPITTYLKGDNAKMELSILVNIFNIPKKIEGILSIEIYNEKEDKIYLHNLTRLEKFVIKKTPKKNYYIDLTYKTGKVYLKKGIYKITGNILNNNKILATSETHIIIE